MKKGKLFMMMEQNADEEKIKEFIIMNGKTKPYCPISFAQEETEKTILDLRNNGYGYLLD